MGLRQERSRVIAEHSTKHSTHNGKEADMAENLDDMNKKDLDSLEEIVKETEPTQAERADQRKLDEELKKKQDAGEAYEGAVDAMWGDEMRGE